MNGAVVVKLRLLPYFVPTAARRMVKKKRNVLRKRDVKPRPMGVFLIRNILNDKVLVVAGINLEGAINKHKFQLASGIHPNPRLQADWNQTSPSNFEFEIVDQLAPVGDARVDHADLQSLLQLWLERLQPFAERGYNEPVISRGEMLSRISARRVKE